VKQDVHNPHISVRHNTHTRKWFQTYAH
jgi:hypothetical protein